MTDTYQWQRSTRTRAGGWQDMPDPLPSSQLGSLNLAPGEVWDDGMGNRYRRVRILQAHVTETTP